MKRIILLALALTLLLPAFSLGNQEEGTVLQPGSSGAQVRRLQTRLMELGLLKGRADALYGKQTAQAVTQAQTYLHQQGHDLRIDGIAGPETLRLLFDDQAMSGLLDLKPGDRGERVSRLQAQLYDIRMLEDLPDGAFGDLTRQAVLRFQKVLVDQGVEGAALSGVADHVTRTALSGDLRPLKLRLPQTFDDRYPKALTPEDLYAKAALVMDMDTGQMFLHKQVNQRLYPASTTKVMTLLLALETLPQDKLVTIPEAAREVPKDSSLTPVTPGEQMPVRDLLYGLMLRSGNDAANALAVLCAGSVEQFVEEMNSKAQTLGLSNTHFTNPHGYHDPEHYTTARDLAVLTRHALQQPEFANIITKTDWMMQQTNLRAPLHIEVNTDLFKPQSPFYYPGAFGVKSGYTRAAGFCYVGCATQDGRTLLAVVLNDRTRNQAWTDMGRLFNLGFAR